MYISKSVKIALLIILLAAILTITLYILPSDVRSVVTLIVIVIGLMITIFPFLKTNVKWIMRYFFCLDNGWWDKRVQRPRLFFYLLYFLLFFLILRDFNVTNGSNLEKVTCFLVFCYSIAGQIILGRILWSEKFEISFLPDIKSFILSEIKLRKLSEDEVEFYSKQNRLNIDNSSMDNLKNFLRGVKIDNKIKWIGTSGKGVITYTDLFRLFHNILEESDEKFIRDRRKKMILMIIDNFEKYSENKSIQISYKSINSAYTNFVLKSKKIL